MRQVIDSNVLQHPALRGYLSNPSNYVVMSDYTAMEAYKGDTLKSIFRSTEILSEFPRQVLILKGTMTTAKLSGRTAGLTKRMIDQRATSDFQVYCRELAQAKGGDLRFQRSLLEHGKWANEHMDRLLDDAGEFVDVMASVSERFTKEEIRLFRQNRPQPTRSMAQKTNGQSRN